MDDKIRSTLGEALQFMRESVLGVGDTTDVDTAATWLEQLYDPVEAPTDPVKAADELVELMEGYAAADRAKEPTPARLEATRRQREQWNKAVAEAPAALAVLEERLTDAIYAWSETEGRCASIEELADATIATNRAVRGVFEESLETGLASQCEGNPSPGAHQWRNRSCQRCGIDMPAQTD